MKIATYLAVAVCAVAFTQEASAQTIVRIVGSTAYRSQMNTALRNLIAGTAGAGYGYVGASANGANQAIYKGTVSSQSVTYLTSLAGSTGGIQIVSQGLNSNYLLPSATTSVGGTSGLTAGTDAQPADCSMADTTQAATQFTTPTLACQKVGVIAFQWVVNKGAPAAITNVTPQMAKALYSSGTLSMALFTGVPGDDTTTIYALGRDFDSGTRSATFAEMGISNIDPVNQYQVTASGGAITGKILWPPYTLLGLPVVEGNGGYNSGGLVATALTNTSPAGEAYVGYMGTSDAATAVTGGAKALNFMGVPYSLQAVQEGSYAFWNYEFVCYKSTLAGAKKTLADALATRIKNFDAAIPLSTMRVVRNNDGGVITQDY